MHSLHVDSMAVPSLLGRSYITNMRRNYVRSDVVLCPRKHCGPASARAVPVLVNAMLTIRHLTHITARCCQVYGPPHQPGHQAACLLSRSACYPVLLYWHTVVKRVESTLTKLALAPATKDLLQRRPLSSCDSCIALDSSGGCIADLTDRDCI